MVDRRVFLLSVPGMAGCFRPSKPRLNVFNWSNYNAKDTIPGFERLTGTEVRMGVYETNEEMLARIQSGNSGWDVIVPSNYFIVALREMGLLAPLDHRRLPNLSRLETQFQQSVWDKDSRYSVPFMWGSSGIAYRKDARRKPASWSDLWEQDWRGRITMLDDPTEVFAACLAKLGLPLMSADLQHLERARDEAIKQKPLLQAYISAEVRDQLVSGDVQAAQLWATTTAQAGVEYCFPQEGYLLYTDCLCVLKESPRYELAHAFVNYMLEEKTSLDIAIETRTAPAIRTSRGQISDFGPYFSTLFPDAATLARGIWTESLPPEAQRLRDRYWTQIKSA